MGKYQDFGQWRKFTFSGGGAKPPKFPTYPPPFALEKTVFSPLLDQNFRKFINFPEGGGRPPPVPPRFPPLILGISLGITDC